MNPILSHRRLPSSANILAAMGDWAKRLSGRMAHLGLASAAVVRHVGIDHKTLRRFLAGTLGHGLQPEQFRRLCEILAITPNQALGLEPMDGADPVPPDARAAAVARVLAVAEGLAPENRALAADLLDRLAHHRAGAGRPESEG